MLTKGTVHECVNFYYQWINTNSTDAAITDDIERDVAMKDYVMREVVKALTCGIAVVPASVDPTRIVRKETFSAFGDFDGERGGPPVRDLKDRFGRQSHVCRKWVKIHPSMTLVRVGQNATVSEY
jgi:hypothetical protein